MESGVEYVNTTVTECPMHAGTEVRIKTLQSVAMFDPTIDMQMAQAGVKSGLGGLLDNQ